MSFLKVLVIRRQDFENVARQLAVLYKKRVSFDERPLIIDESFRRYFENDANAC